jgi:GNAT superfamily N-acetyltransferase
MRSNGAAPLEIHEVVVGTDPDIHALWRLMTESLSDPDTVLAEGRLVEFLQNRDPGRSFHVLVAREVGQPVGGVVFSYVTASRCGFSEYLVVRHDRRRAGIGRQLAMARRSVLDRRARALGHVRARGVFIEVDNPDRAPVRRQEERTASLDAWTRLRVFDRLGFRRVAIPYVQPPLGPGKQPVYYMDLLFAAWDPEVTASRRIASNWIIDTVRPIWRGWSPDRCAEYLDWLARRIPGDAVELLPVLGADAVDAPHHSTTSKTT